MTIECRVDIRAFGRATPPQTQPNKQRNTIYELICDAKVVDLADNKRLILWANLTVSIKLRGTRGKRLKGYVRLEEIQECFGKNKVELSSEQLDRVLLEAGKFRGSLGK